MSWDNHKVFIRIELGTLACILKQEQSVYHMPMCILYVCISTYIQLMQCSEQLWLETNNTVL